MVGQRYKNYVDVSRNTHIHQDVSKICFPDQDWRYEACVQEVSKKSSVEHLMSLYTGMSS